MLCFTDVVLHPTVSGEGVCAGCLAGVPRQLAGRRMEAVMRELDYGKMGMRIRQLRKTKGWSQEELAKKCGISMSFLGHIERGSRIMSLETFVNICGALEAGASLRRGAGSVGAVCAKAKRNGRPVFDLCKDNEVCG